MKWCNLNSFETQRRIGIVNEHIASEILIHVSILIDDVQ